MRITSRVNTVVIVQVPIGNCSIISEDKYMTPKIHEAIIYAGDRHSGQVRKGTAIPYLVHPLEVMGILIENGCSEDVIIAGILHDVIEDTCNDDDSVRKSVKEEIKTRFGETVLNIVNSESEDKSKTWKERKQHTISELKNDSAEVQLVCCADKLSNILSIQADLILIGDKLWQRFNATKEDLKWYYKSIASGLDKISGIKMVEELRNTVKAVFGE